MSFILGLTTSIVIEYRSENHYKRRRATFGRHAHEWDDIDDQVMVQTFHASYEPPPRKAPSVEREPWIVAK